MCRAVCLIARLSTRANSERRSSCSVEEDLFTVRQADMLSRLVRSRLSELMQNRLVYVIVWLFLRMFGVFSGSNCDSDSAFMNMNIYVFFCGFVATLGLKDRYWDVLRHFLDRFLFYGVVLGKA